MFKWRDEMASYRPLLCSSMAPPEAIFVCMRAIIQPILTYGSEIWGYNEELTSLAEKEMILAARMCFRLPRSVSRDIVRRQCGLSEK